VVGDVVERDAESLLREQFARGVEDALAVALGVTSERLVGLEKGDAVTLAISGLALSGFILGLC
jgi:hypothetical protein